MSRGLGPDIRSSPKRNRELELGPEDAGLYALVGVRQPNPMARSSTVNGTFNYLQQQQRRTSLVEAEHHHGIAGRRRLDGRRLPRQ